MGIKIKYTISTIGLILILLATTFSCKKNTTGFDMSGKLDNVEGTSFLAAYESGDSLIIDTVFIDKGQFSFRGSVDTLTIVRLYFNKNTKVPDLFVFVDKGWNVKLKGDVTYPDLIEVKGGNINEDLSAFKKENAELLKSRAQILEAASRDTSSTKDAKKYIVELKNLNFELSNIAAKYIAANPDKISSVVLINTFFKDEALITRLDENLALLKGDAATFPLVDDMKEFSNKIKMSALGAVAPNFSLKDLNGKFVSPSQYRGKYLFLSFVSTTCDVCNEMRPEFVKVYNDLKKNKDNIEFVTVVIDVEDEAITKSVRDSVKWAMLPDYGSWASKVFALYNIREVPYNILISPDGLILERDLPITLLPEKIKVLKAKEVKKEN